MGLRLNAFYSLALCILAVGEITAADSALPVAPADCNSLVLNMVDCLSFVSNGSTTAKPEGTCCSGLKTVLRTDPKCLCEGFKNSADFGVSLNVTKAESLPAACDVPAPPVSNCDLNGAGNPSTSPAAPLSPRSAPPSMGSPAGTSPVPTANSPAEENSVSSIPVSGFAAAMAAAFLVLLF